MSAKGKKSLWYTCESCQVVLTSKDLEIHQEGFCPPEADGCPHGFIKDGVLHGVLEELTAADVAGLQYVPRSQHRRLAVMSVPAMQLCGVAIGDPVVVTCRAVPAVMTAWPAPGAPHRSLLTVRVLPDCVAAYWQSGVGRLVKVEAVGEPPPVAAEVSVSCTAWGEPPELLVSLLREECGSGLVCEGCSLAVRDLGRDLVCRVEQVVPVDTPGDLAGLLGELSCSGRERRAAPHKVVPGTRWSVLAREAPGAAGEPAERRPALRDVGGLDAVVAELRGLLDLCLGRLPPAPGCGRQCGVLLHGPTGCGKTLLSEAVAAESGAPAWRVDAPEVHGDAGSRLAEVFEEAWSCGAPGVLLLGDVDALCPGRARPTDQERRLLSVLLSLLDGLRRRGAPVMVLATTSRLEDVHPALRRPGRLDQELEVGVPSPEGRLDILAKLLGATRHALAQDDVARLARATHGFVGADLASLCAHAGRRAALASRDISRDDMTAALSVVRPSAMREVLVQVPHVRWSDIGGQRDLKLKLRQAVEWPLRHPEAFARLGITPPRGLLMFGPPGCSKTMTAKALATESRLNFLSVKGPELFSKWVGESERAVREVFRRARQVAPAIVFFDELDAVGGERPGAQSQGGGGGSVQERVLAQLLTELDGVEPLGNVVVVGATNRPDRIDKALLRPGRLDRLVYVPLPDADTRREILSMQLARTPASPDVILDELVDSTQGYSGAEVLAVCTEAALKSLEEDISAESVRRCHFLSALQLVTPRTPQHLLQLYRDYQLRS